MKQAFTLDDIIRLLYHETTVEESNLISVALEEDASLNNQMKAVQEVKDELDRFFLTPSAEIVNSILDYSSSEALETQC